jgi:regulator of RNase E activity RraA
MSNRASPRGYFAAILLLVSLPAVAEGCVAPPDIVAGRLAPASPSAVETPPAPSDDPRAGRNFLPVSVHSEEDDQRLLALFAGLRVADVADGMDAAGLHDVGLMDPEIQPLWRDTATFQHRVTGIAVTARYVPAREPPPTRSSIEDYDRWAGAWYRDRSSEPFVALLRKGSVLVIDDHAGLDVGSIGSNNIMSWQLRGCAGVVTNGCARDTDEITVERVPLYFRHSGRGIRPGRNEIESVNRPVVCGGATVVPGDVIVADGDGVIVVPRGRAAEVAGYARKVIEGDKAARRQLYERLGKPLDDTVR